MTFHPRDALLGLGVYLAVCLLALGAGNGLLKLLRVHFEERLRCCFAPLATLVLWILVLGLVGTVGWPLKYVCPWIWGSTLVLFGYGCWGRPRNVRSSLPYLLLCLVLPVLGMVKAFAFGLTEYAWTLGGDGWNYVALAQYHWEFGCKVVEGQPAFYDTGILLIETRHISSSLLALLSCLREGGETITMGSVLQAFALYCAAAAVCFFWLAQQRSGWFTAGATAVTLLCGWALRTVWLANYDNTLFLFFMPALAGVLALMPARDRALRTLVGLLIAAGAYLYVECFLIGMAGVLLLAGPRLWNERAQWRGWLAAGAMTACVSVVLLLPASRMLTGFFVQQATIVNSPTSPRVGEGLMPGFLVPRRFLENAWSLSGWQTTTAADKYKWSCTAGLTVLCVLGLCQLFRGRRWELLLCLGFFGVAVAYMSVRARYDYGVFKLLNLSWWCMAATLVSGAELLVRLRHSDLFRPVAQTALALGAATYAYVAKATQPSVNWLPLGAGLLAGVEWLVCFRTSKVCGALLVSALLSLGAGFAYLSQVTLGRDPGVLGQRLSDFRHTEAIRQITGDEPVLNASDQWLNCLVARYHLRGLNAHPLLYRGIIESLALRGDPRPCSPATRFLLTDTSSLLSPYWSQTASRQAILGSYTLWDLNHDRHGATVVAIDNPYGLERHNNLPGFWLGSGKAVMYVLAARDGEMSLECSFVAGPCGPDRPLRTLRLATPAGFTEQHDLGNEVKTFRIPVYAGLNPLSLEVLDPPTRSHASAADPRTLLLFVTFHSARFVAPGCFR